MTDLTKRDPGFYWVHVDWTNETVIMKWDGTDWWATGSDQESTVEIVIRRVPNPDELDNQDDYERLWETAMMDAIGEDGFKSVAEAIERIKRHRRVLLDELKRIHQGYQATADILYFVDSDMKTFPKS